MAGKDGARSGGSDRPTRFVPFLSHPLMYPLCATFLIFLVLAALERHATGDANRLFNFFQIVSVLFFAALLFRLMLRPGSGSAGDGKVAGSKAEITPYLGLFLALMAGAIAYIRTLPLFFVCDDFAHLNLVRRAFSIAVWPEFTKGQDGTFYRPLGFLSLFQDYRLWHEWAPGYHLTNILLHLVCIAGVFYLCGQLELKSRVCFAAALFFAVLPVNVQNVAWTAARFDQLAAAFGIWSIACAARFRRTVQTRSYWVAILLFVLAVLSKENAYIFPVLWLAREIIPRSGGAGRLPIAKRAAILAGYLLAPAIMLLTRFFLLGGVGGYRSSNRPMALLFPFPSVIGVLVRAPGETMFGYDWFEWGNSLWTLVAVLTAAVFLMLAFRMKTDAGSRPMICFALIWIFVSALPAHFYFWTADPGLFVSRTLYFGAMGAALLLAILLEQTLSEPRLYQAGAIAIGVLLFTGAQYNISAWGQASKDAQAWLAELKREQPSPPPNAIYYIPGAPRQDRGVPLFAAGLESSVRLAYAWRDDIHVVTDANPVIPSDAIVIQYDWPTQ